MKIVKITKSILKQLYTRKEEEEKMRGKRK
jgi:hypothetical protein